TNFALSGTTSNWTSPGGVTTGTSCGTVTAPEINLQGNSNDIVSGTTTTSATNHTDFGGITGTSLARTFTIQNTGTSDLTVSGISVGGTNATEFVVSGITFPATITQGTSTTFIVTFTPTANGTRTATISIANNDCDEAPYTFTVSGGRQGAALALGGTNDYVALTGTNTTLDGVANFTIEHWVKWDGIGGVGLVGKGANGCCTNTIHTGFANSGMFFLKVGNQDGAITDAGVVPTNTWVHLAAVYDGTQSVASNRIKLYKDGVLQNSSMFGSIPAVAPSPNVPFVIGAALSDGTYNYNGQIDEARIWNTARTCDQISQLRNCELAGNETGLVAYYKFNQGVADGSNTGLTTLTNSVSGGSNGTLTNFTLSGTTSNWTSPGGVTTGTSCGTVTAPEINLQGNSSDIVKGATTTSTANHTDFGSNASRTFTIQNTGNTALTVSNMILSGTNASEYSIAGITLPATVNATSSTTFVVNFVSGGSGFRTATVSVNTNDCDEAAYDFAIRALGTPATFTIGFDKRVLHADQRMKPINLSVSIVNGSNPSWQLKSITSTEADAGVAENDQPNDIQNATLNTADTQFDLRAERIGRGGNGRVYLVTLQLTDNGVNRDTVFAIVVPVNLGLSRMDATGSTIANVVVAQTSPNPNTAGNVTLTMTSPQANANRVQVRVFNSRGKDIQWLYNAALASGTTSLSWNVTDRQGATVPNGVYYIQVLGDGVISTPLPVRINR
ncbi:MAG: choice-of-anchor D domain-containing protein, partial [Candidatus Kapabacteria bacterium]|nr:choice-of-anchor D domain-containing protein [Candidatus Kapabacteria bacterium]